MGKLTLCAFALLAMSRAYCLDKGFNFLFTTSTTEIDNMLLDTNNDVPKWIRGIWIRNGPGRFEMGNRKVTHYFDGFAKMARFEFKDGSVRFTTKFMESNVYKDSVKSNDIAPYLTVGELSPPFNPVQQLQAYMKGMDNMDVNVATLSKGTTKRFYALNDIWRMYEFNGTSLATIGVVNPPTIKETAKLDVHLSSAHPIKEYGSQSWITYHSVWNPLGKSKFFVYRIRSLENPEVVATFETERLHYMHSFGVSKHYAIFVANSCYMDMIKGISSVPFEAIECDQSKQTPVFVVNLQSGKVEELETDPVFTFHHINAFELDENTIVVDTTDQVDFSLVKDFTLENLLDAEKRNNLLKESNRLVRLVIHLDKNTIDLHALGSTEPGYEFMKTTELPIINENKRYDEYCYFYGMTFMSYSHQFANMSLTKTGVCGNKGDKFWHVDNHYPSEPWFVPRPGAVDEDDGALLSVVLDGEKRKSYIAIIDAKTMQSITSVYLPVPIPLGFHGKFF